MNRSMLGKRQRGQYYTVKNPFAHPAFRAWARRAGLPQTRILEPFAGANSLIDHLAGMSLCRTFAAFDIAPASDAVVRRNTLASFPSGFEACVTNPPWLARNSATLRGIDFPNCEYDDLYKFALRKCLDNCPYVAALVPESFIRAGVLTERLVDFVSLPTRLFADTENPVGLALFAPQSRQGVRVWSGRRKVGLLCELERLRPVPDRNGPSVSFNDPNGNVGLIALDNTFGRSIRFCKVGELAGYQVKPSSRYITKLYVDAPIRIDKWNRFLERFRDQTQDVLLTCYKGIRKDGKYRRRLDWQAARGIVHCA